MADKTKCIRCLLRWRTSSYPVGLTPRPFSQFTDLTGRIYTIETSWKEKQQYQSHSARKCDITGGRAIFPLYLVPHPCHHIPLSPVVDKTKIYGTPFKMGDQRSARRADHQSIPTITGFTGRVHSTEPSQKKQPRQSHSARNCPCRDALLTTDCAVGRSSARYFLGLLCIDTRQPSGAIVDLPGVVEVRPGQQHRPDWLRRRRERRLVALEPRFRSPGEEHGPPVSIGSAANGLNLCEAEEVSGHGRRRTTRERSTTH